MILMIVQNFLKKIQSGEMKLEDAKDCKIYLNIIRTI